MKSFITYLKSLFTHKDVFLNIFVCIIWGNMLLGYTRGIINHLPLLNDYTDEVVMAIVVVPLILSLPLLMNKFTVLDYTFFLFLLVIYLTNYAIHPENTEYLNKNFFNCLCIATPMYFWGRIIDIDKYYSIFTLISIMCIAISAFYFAHYAQTAKNMAEVANDDNMYAAYQVLPHVILLLWNSLKKFNIFYIVFTIIGIMFLLSCGTRGPLACVAFFGIVYFIFFMNFRFAILIKGLLLSIGGILFLFLHEIVSHLAFLFTGLNLSTRILDKFITGELGNDSGRGSIKNALYYILDNSDSSMGLGYFGSQRFGYVYPHDLILDFQLSYGYILGNVILFCIVCLCIFAFHQSKTKQEKCMFLMMLTLTIIKLLLSGTFLTEMFFYAFLGYCCKILLENREIRIEYE